MANNLMKQGYPLLEYDILSSIRNDAEKKRLTIVSPDQMIDQGIIIMLSSGQHVQEVYLGKEGIIKNLSSNQILIDASTVSPDIAQKIFHLTKTQKVSFLDAPVSRGVRGAEAGTLTFLVGGERELCDQTKAVFLAMGKKTFYAGPSGSGQVAKLCNNLLLSITMIGSAEAISLGIKNQIDPKVLAEIIGNSTGSCWSINSNNPVPGVSNSPTSNDYQGGFKSELMLKDLALAIELAMSSKSMTSIGSMAHSLYLLHNQKGSGKLDFSSIIKTIAE